MSYYCANCDREFRSQNAIDSHCYAKGHNQIWYCDPCSRWFTVEAGYNHHSEYAQAHRTCSVCNMTFQSASGLETHCSQSKKHKQLLCKSVECHFCDRTFKSPSAYAQHIESGVHRVNRHHVTYAVQSLRVVPTITVPSHPGLLGTSFASIEAATDSSDSNDHSPIASSLQPTTAAAEVTPGPPLLPQEASREFVFTGAQAGPLMMTSTTYVPADFVNLGIPYACHLCFQTFRTIFALTMHMNSAVHDPAAFKCPGRCKKQFSLISGLIQHLESGSCGLASKEEVYNRFEKLTARFSRMLTM